MWFVHGWLAGGGGFLVGIYPLSGLCLFYAVFFLYCSGIGNSAVLIWLYDLAGSFV